MNQYRPGDVVARRKGLVMHKGIVMPDGQILHNIPIHGEQICSLEEFSNGKRVYVTGCRSDRFDGSALSAVQNPPRPYCLFTNNCEHTVTRFTHGSPRSPQLRGWIAGVSVAACTLALSRHRGASASAFSLARMLMGRLGRQA
ncbi:MAG: hypothetical protein ACNA7W_06870 [Pseudomonadales bacterium]